MSKTNNLKTGCVKTILLAAVGMFAFVVLWAIVNFRSTVKNGEPLIPVTSQATIVEAPLNGNGDVDYLEALNLLYADGVTPENNSMVKIVEGLGPVVNKGALLPDEFFVRLGIAPLPQEGLYYVSFGDFLEAAGYQRSRKEGTPFYDLFNDYEAALEEVWDPETNPMLEAWYQRNQKPIQMIRKGLERPKYYFPLINANGDGLGGASLSVCVRLRLLARFFNVSANRNLELGQIDLALEDVLAMYRLGQHSSSSATLVEELVGIAISDMANFKVAAICVSKKPSSQQLRKLQKAVEGFVPCRSLAKILQSSERFTMMDTLISIGRGEYDALTPDGTMDLTNFLTGIGGKTVDWQECSLVVNAWYDRLVDVAKIEDDQKRLQAFLQIEKEMAEMDAEVRSPSSTFLTVLGGRESKGKAMGQIMNGMLTPSCSSIANAETRSKTYFRITQIFISLAAFEKDNGFYPKTLAQLVPQYIKSIPLDPYSNLEFKYSLVSEIDINSNSGSLTKLVPEVYSVGLNGTDDTAATPTGEERLDDIAIPWN